MSKKEEENFIFLIVETIKSAQNKEVILLPKEVAQLGNMPALKRYLGTVNTLP